MRPDMKTWKLRIGGMTCVGCQKKIEKKLCATAGVQRATARYASGDVIVTYDQSIVSAEAIAEAIRSLNYEVLSEGEKKPAGAWRTAVLLIIMVGLYLLLERLGVLTLLSPSRLAEANMGYGMLFVIGLLTSVHCVAMCGGISLSQCVTVGSAGTGEKRFSALRPAFLYNAGRVLSYTVVGGIVGALGSAITFSNAAQGALKLIAGAFMIMMGITMLDLFPWLRRLVPRMPRFLAQKIDAEKMRARGPLVVGLLNGLMPCGPLQAMQIYALSTGSPVGGAVSMLLFSLGTVPLMFGFGALSAMLSQRFAKRFMTVGALLVAVLGLSMCTQGWNLAGASTVPSAASSSLAQSAPESVAMEGDVQTIHSTLTSRRYPAITVDVGTPVEWIIDAPRGSINGCNNRIFIPEYGIEYTFKDGENIITFTPSRTGTFRYSCWMGMIYSEITVVDVSSAAS